MSVVLLCKRKHICEFSDCGMSFGRKWTLMEHTRTHTGNKPFSCDECDFKTARKCALVVHKRLHSGDRPFKCNFEECTYSSPESGNLLIHSRTHTGERPFKCTFEACSYSTVQCGTLKTHMLTHTPEGQARRKKQEGRILSNLKKWGHVVDCETIINIGKGNCVDDTSYRHFSRLDFVLLDCASHILIVECDENQHYWYTPECEMSRMVDVKASLVLSGNVKPIHWIRYSPCGKYMVGDKEDPRYTTRYNRELELEKYIRSVCSGDVYPNGDMSIHYMFYDRIIDGPPELIRSESFPSHLDDFVTWNV